MHGVCILEKAIKFKNERKLILRGYVHEPKKYDTAVIFLHGFPGDMFGTAQRMCKSLSKLGYLVMRFNFSGTGTSE